MNPSSLHPQTVRRFLIASALYLSLSPAYAADPPKSAVPGFAQLDVNRDGFIDGKEARASDIVSSWLKTADRDRDGRLSELEFLNARDTMNKPEPMQ
ncbi:MAG: EF-hand domain-containing protein [Rhodocyclaceae bacterium]